MKKTLTLSGVVALASIVMFSCKKNTTEKINLSPAKVLVSHPISNPMGYPSPDSIKAYSGTMVAGTTYTIVGNVEVNKGDTIFVQPGVTVCVENGACIVVKGAFISMGTQANPNWFTKCGRTKTDNIGQSQATDSAWSGGSGLGLWPGIECDTSATLLVLKWTHLEFTGAGCNSTVPNFVGVSTSKSYGILFQNTNGNFIMEDSWMYGGCDDAIRVQTGHMDIMRNNFEKAGYQGGDCFNIKSGGIGDVGYNLFVGCATNGTKASNKGGNPVQCNVNMFNNTYINCGFRQNQSGRGANINYEQGAKGSAYNNLIVDGKFGFRIVGNPGADTANCFYGNNFIYGDSTNLTTQFYPVGYITKPNAYVVPNPAVTGYVYNPTSGAPLPVGTELSDDIALDGANNPMFVNFPLPENSTNFPGMTSFFDINNNNPSHGWDFHLKTGSPCIGIGNTDPSYMLNACSAVSNPNWGPNESLPCSDVGCYPATYNGGNQH